MIQRYILTYNETSITLTDAPEGWRDLKYAISRNTTYHGLFFDFSGELRFTGDGKTFIDNVLDNNGFEAEIGITIKELNQSTRAFETKIDGVINFDPEVYVREELFTSMNFISSRVHQKFMNREDQEIAYNRKESINGTTLPGFVDEFVDVIMRGRGTDTATARAAYPFEAFNRVLQVICDLDYNPLLSSELGRPLYEYVEDGDLSKVMISKGLLMRGYTEAGDTYEEGKTNLNLSFKELFENFSKIFNLGIGLEYDTENDRWQFVFEKRNYFYQTNTILTIDKNYISNLKYEFSREMMNSRIDIGYQKYVEENQYGLTEYNNKSQFATPISITDKSLNLEVSYRADGLGFQVAIDSQKSGTDQTETNIDEDIFLIDSIEESDSIKSRQNEGFQLIDGLYGDNVIQANIRMSPVRNMIRWGDWIKASLSKLTDKDLKFLKAEKLSALRSQLNDETVVLYETRDYAVSDLKQTRWSGRVAKFEAPLTRDQINTIIDNPYGLVKYWDYHDKVWKYGWIREASTDRIDKDTTWELYEATNIDEVANNLVYVSDGEPIELMSGKKLTLVNP